MLYYIFRFLEQYDIPGAHIWSYISFRSLLALILSLIISAWFGEYFIKWMKRRNISETARDPSIDPFGVEKKGVPTMGGIIIIVSKVDRQDSAGQSSGRDRGQHGAHRAQRRRTGDAVVPEPSQKSSDRCCNRSDSQRPLHHAAVRFG